MSLSEEIQGKVATWHTKISSTLLAAAALAVAISIYTLCHFVDPGWLTWSISFVALSVIIVTALARANDLQSSLKGFRWEVRRAGLLFVCGGAFLILLQGGLPEWRDVFLYVGFAMTWFTTPHMPPWWKYIAGKEPVEQGLH
jgi:hypothetical protein